MTNPASAMRMLITYAIVIPLAIVVGYLLTDPLDYGTLGFFGLVVALLLSPVFIKWHYPILVFGLGCPMLCFFLVGRPPLWQVVVLLSLGISIVERTVSSRRFISAPVVTWPLLYVVAMTYMTSTLTGGIGLHQLGGEGGGGKKYLIVLIGVAAYFALTSRAIPKEKRNFYIALYVLSATTGCIGDVAAELGGPFHALNLLFPSALAYTSDVSIGTTRLSTLGVVFSMSAVYMLVRYGLRGIFLSSHIWRIPVFLLLFALAMLGGYRTVMITFLMIFFILFFLEGLHHSRLLPMALLAGILFLPMLLFFSDQLPHTFQRSLSFLPLKWDATVVDDAKTSSDWRLRMWAALWPQVPQYLLLGKGYSLTEEDFQKIGTGVFAGLGAGADASQETLAISGDYHSGPLSTLIPFGIWGGIAIVWLMAVSLFVYYRNFRYGDPDLKTFNAYLLAAGIASIIVFFFIFGGYQDSILEMSKGLGISVALNWGVCRPTPKPVYNPRIKPLPVGEPVAQSA